MIATIAIRVGEAWAVAAGLQLVLWLVQQRTRNAGIVDVGWALAFTLVVGGFALRAEAPVAGWAPLAAIVCAWSLRLGSHLIARGAARGPEEGRYADLRQRWGPRASARFFVFFQAQAALTGILASAFAVPFVAAPRDTGWLRAIGAAIAVIGIAGESLADVQLARWKRSSAHRGQVCDAGLWAYSRHPNYFFEWCVWLGFAGYGLAFWPYGAIALVAQLIILGSILGVTGIPPTETQAVRSKGDAYRAYQARVSKFIPWPPKRSARNP